MASPESRDTTEITAIRNHHSHILCALRPKCEIHSMQNGKISGRGKFQYVKEPLQNFVRRKSTKSLLMKLSLRNTTS
jgi:hypothetical protein